MQDPNADTQWNDVLRAKGIIPQKETEISEDDIVNILEQTVQEKQNGKDMSDMTLTELNDVEDDLDDEDERMFEQYRRQRIAEMQANYLKAKYGDVGEISKADYVREVNEAGEGVWVILHIYKQGIPLCSLINQYLSTLARKFPATKILKSVSSVCIPNYPDKNLPTIFVYYEGDLKKQWVGPLSFGGMNLKINELEWMLSQCGAIQSEIEEPVKPVIKDVMNVAIKQSNIHDNSDDDY